NVSDCSGGFTAHPCGTWSRTAASAAPTVSLTTVTRISRSALGAAEAAADREAAPLPAVVRRTPGLAGALRIDAAGKIATSGVEAVEFHLLDRRFSRSAVRDDHVDLHRLPRDDDAVVGERLDLDAGGEDGRLLELALLLAQAEIDLEPRRVVDRHGAQIAPQR